MVRTSRSAERTSHMTAVPHEFSVPRGVASAPDTLLDDAHAAQSEGKPLLAIRSERIRLFAVLGWAGGGVCASAALALLLAIFSDVQFGQVGSRGAVSCVLVGMAVFAGVATLAVRISRAPRSGAQLLLWGTALVHAVLIEAFETALARGDPDIGAALSGFVASVVLGVAAAVLLVSSVSCAIGFNGKRSTPLRWGAALVLFALPTALVEPSVWWMGALGACLLAWTADGILSGCRRRSEAPAPALAACTAAGIVALVLLVVFIASRYALQFVLIVAEVLAGA